MTKSNNQTWTHETFSMKVENENFPWWVTHEKFSIMDYVWKVLHDGPLMINSPCMTSHETFSMMDYSRKVLHFHHSIIRHSPGNGWRLGLPPTHHCTSRWPYIYAPEWLMKSSPFPSRYHHAGNRYNPAPCL